MFTGISSIKLKPNVPETLFYGLKISVWEEFRYFSLVSFEFGGALLLSVRASVVR